MGFVGVLQAALATLLRLWAIDYSLPTRLVLLSELVFGLMFVALSLGAHYGALRLSSISATLLALGCLIAGSALCILTHQGSLALSALMAGDVLVSIGRCWSVVTCATGVAFSWKHEAARQSTSIPILAVGVAYLIFVPLSRMGAIVEVVAMALDVAVGLFVGMVACRQAASEEPDTLEISSPNELEVTNPLSFIPILSKFYLALFVFEMTFGVGAIQGLSRSSLAIGPLILGLMLLAVSLVSSLLPRQKSHEDSLLGLCAVLVIAGLSFECAASPLSWGARLVVTLGAQCFYALTWSALTVAGGRNPIGATLTICRGFAISTLGSFLGGAFVASAASLFPTLGPNVPLAVVETLLFLVLWLFLRDFRMEELFDSLAPVQVAREGSSPADQSADIKKTISELSAHYHLTAREREVAELLASGVNGSGVQEKLVISRNTAKTHIRHIYQKLDVHSQQELIELVSAHSAESERSRDNC